MRKQTQATQAATTVAAPAAKAPKANKAPAAPAPADEGDEGDEGEGGVSQWARELARRAEGKGNACRRYDALAFALASVHADGKGAVSFAEANKLAGLNRGAQGNAVQSWRLAVQRMRQSFGGADTFAAQFGFTVAVDAEANKLVLSKAE